MRALSRPIPASKVTERKPAIAATFSITAFEPDHISEYPPATAAVSATTTALWPSANQKPTETGVWPRLSSWRVMLSMAAKWSQSTACLRPRTNARPA